MATSAADGGGGAARAGGGDAAPRVAADTERAVPAPGEAALDADAQRRTALWSLGAAGVLVVLKLGTGLLTGSLALVSAGVESSGDVVAALLTLLAIRMAVRPADSDHPYGHRRAENVAALGEAGIVAAGGVVIGVEAVMRLADPGEAPDTHWYVFVVVAIALAIDLSRIVVSLRAARRYRSAAFRSNAFNFAGDLAGSIAVLLGLGLVAGGVAAGDAIAALVVAALIFVAVVRLTTENVRALMDYAPEDTRRAVEAAIAALDPPIELRRLRLREAAGGIFADVAIGLPPATAVTASHDVADRVEQAIRGAVEASDVVVHVEPRVDDVELRERVLATALADPDIGDAHDVAVFQRRGRAIVSLHLKFREESSIAHAHGTAERVEAAIRALGPIDAVHTHLEPLERPITLFAPAADAAARSAQLQSAVAGLLGRPAQELELCDTDTGPVLFLTIGVAPGTSLVAAHDAASDLESDLRVRHPELADVVVHTEPE